LSKYCGAHLGGQHGAFGCGAQQRGLGGQHGSEQHESSQQLLQQLVSDRANAPINARFNNFFIRHSCCFFNLRIQIHFNSYP
jgi:hypothetical protein